MESPSSQVLNDAVCKTMHGRERTSRNTVTRQRSDCYRFHGEGNGQLCKTHGRQQSSSISSISGLLIHFNPGDRFFFF